MRCRKCGLEIDDDEIFCKDCRKQLKKSSSKKELNELEYLISDQIELNKLEQTKELDNLKDFVLEEIEHKEENINNEVIDNESEKSVVNEADKNEDDENIDNYMTREERKDIQNKNKTKSKKKKKFILIILGMVLFIAIMIGAAMFFKNKKDDTKETVDYKKILDNYGKRVSKEVINYYNENEEIPSLEYINDYVKDDKYKITCNIHEFYSDGIYLDECMIDNEEVEYSYGEKKEYKPAITLNIYKIEVEDNLYSYFDTNEQGSVLAGTITCKEECKYLTAFNKYVIVKENNAYYLYDYENDILVSGPFNSIENDNLLYDKNNLYGIYYNDNGINRLYSISGKKSFSSIKGTLHNEDNYNILYKYNYVVFNNKGINDFINLNTGNVSYSIKGTIEEFREDKKNKLVYMLVYEDNSNNFIVYNSNGKELFDGDKLNNFIFNSNNFIVSTNNNYKVYDSKLELKTNSKFYESILGIYEDFVVVVDDGKLKIVDLNDKELATFELDWNKNYSLDYEKSGRNTIGDENEIYLYIKDKYSTGFTCYSDTKENTACY